jgi:hypothetical protein
VSSYGAPLSLRRLVGGDPNGLLRLALRLDAAASGAFGLLSLVAGPLLDAWLGIPPAVRWPVGLFLVAYAAALWAAAMPSRIYRPSAWGVIVLNGLWVIASGAVVAGGWLGLTGLGVAVVLAQAVGVALFAELQVMGLRRARPAAA